MKRVQFPANASLEKFLARYKLHDTTVMVRGDAIYVPDESTPADPVFDSIVGTPEFVQQVLAKDLVVAGVSSSVFARAIAAVLLDELNAHALKINSILDAVDAATSLADLKTRIGLIADYPQRTLAQAKTSINNKIDSGEAD